MVAAPCAAGLRVTRMATSRRANWAPCSPRSAVKASPGPWRWDVEAHSSNVLRAADGDTIALYDMPYSRARGEMDVSNRTLIRLAPDMASMLRELEWRGQ